MKPVIGLDVDGTLAAYHDHFAWFASHWMGKDDGVTPWDIADSYDGSRPFYQWLGISKATYRKIKLGYRQSGLKRSMPYFWGARELSSSLRRAGAQVVICTTRPYLHLSNIEPDLREWLRRNRIQYDDLILGEHKYRELVRGYGRDNIVGILDDLPEMVRQARDLGLYAILHQQPHNLHFPWSPIASDLAAARVMLSEQLAARRPVGGRRVRGGAQRSG